MADEAERPAPEASPEHSGRSQIQAEHIGGCVVARLAGEFDLSNAPDLQVHLCGLAEQGRLVVDLSKVDFIDSTALSAMIAAYHRADALGTSVHLAGARGSVRKVLEVTKLDHHFDHRDKVADAIEAAGATSASPDN